MNHKTLYLRKAEPADMELLLEWANDKSVRKNAFHTAKISYEEHQRWFKKLLADETQVQYILTDGTSNIGQIRIGICDGCAEADYSIAVKYRGKGYGKEIIRLLTETVKRDFPEIKKITGKVKPENDVSIHCFADNGFCEIYRAYEYKLERSFSI